MFVCPFFSPPFRCPISNQSTDLESLGQRGANKNIYKPIEAEIKILKTFSPKVRYVCPKQMSVPNNCMSSIQLYIEHARKNVCPKQISVLHTALYRGSNEKCLSQTFPCTRRASRGRRRRPICEFIEAKKFFHIGQNRIRHF